MSILSSYCPKGQESCSELRTSRCCVSAGLSPRLAYVRPFPPLTSHCRRGRGCSGGRGLHGWTSPCRCSVPPSAEHRPGAPWPLLPQPQSAGSPLGGGELETPADQLQGPWGCAASRPYGQGGAGGPEGRWQGRNKQVGDGAFVHCAVPRLHDPDLQCSLPRKA